MTQFPIPRILLFFSLGIALSDQLRQYEAMPVYCGIALLSSLLAFFLLRKNEMLASLSLLTSSIILGAFLMSIDWQSKRINLPQEKISYEAVISSPPVFKNDKFTCDLTTTSFESNYKLKAYIKTDTTLHIGERISCTSRWNEPINFTASPNFNYALYLKRHGYTATTFINLSTTIPEVSSSGNPTTVPEASPSGKSATVPEASASVPLSLYPLILRDKLLSILFPSRAISQEDQSSAIIAAMLLGDKSQLSQQTKDDYSAAGVSHVLALSGLHISILLSIISILFSKFSIRTTTIIQLIFVWAFAFLVGMPTSILRVAIMFTLIIIARTLGHSPYSLNTLFVAAFIILLFSPQSLYDVSFQLSFTAVFFILVISRCLWSRIDSKAYRKHRKKLYIFNIFLISFAAQLGTLPLILYHFGKFPIYFLLTNLFIGIFATAILSLGFLTLIVSFIPVAFTFCQRILVFIASTMNDYIHFMAALPCSSIQEIYINIPQVILCYILIFLLIKPFLPEKFVY